MSIEEREPPPIEEDEAIGRIIAENRVEDEEGPVEAPLPMPGGHRRRGVRTARDRVLDRLRERMRKNQ